MNRRAIALCLLALAVATHAVAGEENLAAMEPTVASAVRQARGLALQEPEDATRWGRLGGVCHAHGLLEEAAEAYGRAAAIAEDSFVWHYLAAVALDEMGRGDQAALDRFERAAGVREDYSPLWIRWGQALSRRGRYAEARDALSRAVELSPDSPLAQRALGQALLGLGEFEAALEPLQRALTLEPKDRSVYVALSRVYARLGANEEAESASHRARRLKARSGIPDPLLTRYVEAMGVSSRHRLSRAQHAIGRGEFDEAIALLTELRTTLPQEADVLHLLGVALRGSGNEDEAIEAWRQALSLHPTHVRAHVAWGTLLRDRRQYAEGLTHYEAAREITPYDPSLLAAIGGLHERAGQLKQAVATYRLLVELEPEVELVRARLAHLLTRLESERTDRP